MSKQEMTLKKGDRIMKEEKPWYKSKAVWGGLVAVAAGAATVFGYQVSPADQAHLPDLLIGLVELIGGFTAVWGRVAATKFIRRTA